MSDIKHEFPGISKIGSVTPRIVSIFCPQTLEDWSAVLNLQSAAIIAC